MKKVLISIFVALCMLFIVANAADIYIDGKKVYYDNQSGYPYVENGRTMVPLRTTMESFGATVDWESDTRSAIVRKGTVTVRCPIGENCIYRNNVRIPNDAASVEFGGRTYLPIRAVLEAFGATVNWDGSVRVQSSGDLAFIESVENTPSVTTNYWKYWNSALSYKNAGNYQKAIDTILSISNQYIKTNDSASCAMLYNHLGECYANLGNYSLASACYKKEAEYWSKTPGQEQSNIDASRRAKLIATDTRIFARTSNPELDGKTHFNELHEPVNSVYLGAYAEGDNGIYNPYNPNAFYMDTYPELLGTDVKGYILYLPYGTSVSLYDSHIRRASEKDKILQIALEPGKGLWQVNAWDGYLINLAAEMENYNCKFILRFAGEMNDTTSDWYTSNPAEYIEKFRTVADVFHTYAPSIPVMWSPNFYPSETMDDYYPGDEYVDYVGISSYMVHQPVTDPLKQGVDRSRWSTQLDTIYSLYGHKKPIIIAEGGSSYVDYDTLGDLTDFASRQITDFYTYLPIKYPNVKMAFLFDSDEPRRKFTLSGNSRYLDAYRSGISSDIYSVYDGVNKGSYCEVGNNVQLEAKPTELCAHITTPTNDTAYVIYYINGVQLGVSYGIPYSVVSDFTSYKGQRVNITVKSFDSSHRQITDYTVTVTII